MWLRSDVVRVMHRLHNCQRYVQQAHPDAECLQRGGQQRGLRHRRADSRHNHPQLFSMPAAAGTEAFLPETHPHLVGAHVTCLAGHGRHGQRSGVQGRLHPAAGAHPQHTGPRIRGAHDVGRQRAHVGRQRDGGLGRRCSSWRWRQRRHVHCAPVRITRKQPQALRNRPFPRTPHFVQQHHPGPWHFCQHPAPRLGARRS